MRHIWITIIQSPFILIVKSLLNLDFSLLVILWHDWFSKTTWGCYFLKERLNIKRIIVTLSYLHLILFKYLFISWCRRSLLSLCFILFWMKHSLVKHFHYELITYKQFNKLMLICLQEILKCIGCNNINLLCSLSLIIGTFLKHQWSSLNLFPFFDIFLYLLKTIN